MGMLEYPTDGTVAWGDESARADHDPPIYMMCATVFGENAGDGLRSLAETKPAGMRKYHWYDLKPQERKGAVTALVRMPQCSTIAIASPMGAGVRQERGRRKCLEKLLPHLESMGVGTYVLEGRWKQQNAADLDMAKALRSRQAIAGIRIEHARADAGDPRLWVPDLVLGVFGDILCNSAPKRSWTKVWNDAAIELTTLFAPVR